MKKFDRSIWYIIAVAIAVGTRINKMPNKAASSIRNFLVCIIQLERWVIREHVNVDTDEQLNEYVAQTVRTIQSRHNNVKKMDTK